MNLMKLISWWSSLDREAVELVRKLFEHALAAENPAACLAEMSTRLLRGETVVLNGNYAVGRKDLFSAIQRLFSPELVESFGKVVAQTKTSDDVKKCIIVRAE